MLSVPISIHAPREGGDADAMADYEQTERISIHAPREGGDTHGEPQSLVNQ